ncbi:MAG: hypothetical protein DRN05_06460, partial [Thermoplasmata archaeon]
MTRKNMIQIQITAISIFIILLGALLPSATADSKISIQGFTKGVSWKPVIPMKKITMINFDGNSLIDDYTYLAAVPTSVFYDENGKHIFSNPLVFYQDRKNTKDDKERSLNARQGLDYFMEDWMSYCNGYLDQMTLINVPKNSIPHEWKAKEYTIVEGDDPYQIAS